MSSWSEGYVTEADYVANYVPELNPLRSRLLLAHAGFAPQGPMAHACELGFGLGLNTVIHAAASNITWWGTDFSPSQTLFASNLASSGGVDLQLFDQSFAEFCHRTDLPDFDFVALHGVWSWISDANRTEVIDFLRRKLRVGGTVYISANSMPGCAQMVPVRNLMRTFFDRGVAPADGSLANAKKAQAFAEKLLQDNPQMAAAYPLAARAVEAMKHHGPQYISHEYLNRDWRPMSFSEIADLLDASKLGFACSATASHHFDQYFLTHEQQQALSATPDFKIRETMRDFMINRGFRRDYWVKGGLRAPAAAMRALLQQRLVLARPKAGATRHVPEGALTPELTSTLVEPMLDLLADHQAHSVEYLVQALAKLGHAEPDVLRTLLCLVANYTLACAQDEASVATSTPRAQKLNAEIVRRSMDSSDVSSLASPVTGGGIGVPQIQLQMLAARASGHTDPQQWASQIWPSYRAKGQVFTLNGIPLRTDEENLHYIGELGQTFSRLELPMLQALGCVA
jgi:hypothetical protein